MPQKNVPVTFLSFFAHEACWSIVSGRHVHATKSFRQNRAPSQMFLSRQDEHVSFISPRLHFQVVRGFRRQTFGAMIFFFPPQLLHSCCSQMAFFETFIRRCTWNPPARHTWNIEILTRAIESLHHHWQLEDGPRVWPFRINPVTLKRGPRR